MNETDTGRETMRRIERTALRRKWVPIAAWCSYDWANSAFSTVISTFIFAAYFAQAVASNPIEGTVLWSRAVAVAGLIVAIVSPMLGAIVDFSGARKPWLGAFTAACAGFTALLWFVRPAPDFVLLALGLYVMASISCQIAIVFYDAMLKSLAPRKLLGRVSGWGWASGYAGGLACLILCLWFVHDGGPARLDLDAEGAEPVRATAVLAAMWFAVFSIPLFLLVPDRPNSGLSTVAAAKAGLRQLPNAVSILRRSPSIFRFLISHMLYTDGLVTLFAFSGIYAAAEFGMTPTDILTFGIVLNVAAGAGTAAFAWLDDAIGSRNTILLSLGGLLVGIGGLILAESLLLFWAVATILGLFVGPAQAAGRSLMARLAPDGIETEMFGLYSLAGKATAFVGPLVLGIVAQWSGSQRAGLVVVLALLLAGLLVLFSVKEPRSPDPA